MPGWVRYALMVGVILLGGLVVWLVRSPGVTAPALDQIGAPMEPQPYPNPPADSGARGLTGVVGAISSVSGHSRQTP